MIDYDEFVNFVKTSFFETNQDFNDGKIDDWEQVWFNKLEDKLDTDSEKVIASIFYSDETITDVVQCILNDLSQETVLQSVCFDADSETTVVVCMVTKY